MFLKKNIIFFGLLIATVLITGCDWSCCKKSCNIKEIKPEKEVVLVEEYKLVDEEEK